MIRTQTRGPYLNRSAGYNLADYGVILGVDTVAAGKQNVAAFEFILAEMATRGYGGKIVLPAGMMYVWGSGTRALQLVNLSGLDVEGQGWGVSTVKLVSGTSGNLFSVGVLDRVTVGGFTMDGNRDNLPVGLFGSNLRGEALRDCYFHDIESTQAGTYCMGFEDDYTDNVWIENCKLSYSGRDNLDTKNWYDGNRGIFIRNITCQYWNMRPDRTQDCAMDLRGRFNVDGVIARNPGNITADGVRVRQETIEAPPGTRTSYGGHYSQLDNIDVDLGVSGDAGGIIGQSCLYIVGHDVQVGTVRARGGQFGAKVGATGYNVSIGSINSDRPVKNGLIVVPGADDAYVGNVTVVGSGEAGAELSANRGSISALSAYQCYSGLLIGAASDRNIVQSGSFRDNTVRAWLVDVNATNSVIANCIGIGVNTAGTDKGIGTILENPAGFLADPDAAPISYPGTTNINFSNVALTALTGTTSRTQIGSNITIAKGMLGRPSVAALINGTIRIQGKVTGTSSANLKTLEIALNTTVFGTFVFTNSGGVDFCLDIIARNSAASQISAILSAIGTSATPTSASGTVSLAVAQMLRFYGTLANSGETMTVEAYTVSIIRP